MKGKYHQQPKCVACSYGVGSYLGAKLQSFMFSSLSSSDRIIPNLDTLVPFDSTKAYDILDVIYPVSSCDQSITNIILLQNALQFCGCSPSTVKFLPPIPPPLFFSVPVLSVKCFDNITHSIQAVRDESKVFSTLNTEGRWKLVNNTIFLLDLYEEIYFLFFYIPNTETVEISNATLYVFSLQPILSLNNISMCGYLITREIITVTSEPASLMRNALISSLGILLEWNEYAILNDGHKDILSGSKM